MRRRSFVKGAGVLVGGTTVSGGSASATGTPLAFVDAGENEFDLDGSGDPGVRVYRTPDPIPNSPNKAEDDPGSRGLVAVITSDGVPSTDYATSIVDVPDRPFSSVTDISFQFHAGVTNENAAPDECWMLVEEDDGTRHVLFDTYNLETNDPGWQGVNVIREQGHHRHPVWKELVDASTIGTYEVSDTDVLRRLGVGRGSTRVGRVSEVYYDQLRINGDLVGDGDFPARGVYPVQRRR